MSRISIARRLQIEDEVIAETIKQLDAAGWTLEGVDDGGEEFIATSDPNEVLEFSDQVGTCQVFFVKLIDGKLYRTTLFLVRGNDGPDVIADHSVFPPCFEDVMDRIYDWCRRYDREVYGMDFI